MVTLGPPKGADGSVVVDVALPRFHVQGDVVACADMLPNARQAPSNVAMHEILVFMAFPC
jgi:hypothetical protein